MRVNQADASAWDTRWLMQCELMRFTLSGFIGVRDELTTRS